MVKVTEMKEKINRLFEEAIKLELNAAALYTLFYEAFPDDSNFWWQLILEEKGHASLLEAGKRNFAPKGLFPLDLLAAPLEELIAANKDVEQLIERYRENIPSREEAFNVAMLFERFAGEAHFQQFMIQDADSGIKDTFRHLNRDDKDHEKRISDFMKRDEMMTKD